MLQIKSAYIEITDKCNLDCEFCYNSSGKKTKHSEMNVHDIKAVIQKLIPLGLESLAFSGGEPLLHSNWPGIYKTINLFPNIMFSVITNGTINNPYLLKLNEENENFNIQISLDGHDENSNSKIRGKGNFQKSIKTIKRLAATNNKPSVKLVLSKLNQHSLEPFTKLILSINALPEFGFVSNIGNANVRWSDIALSPIEKVRIIKKIKKLSEKYGTEIALPMCANGCPLHDKEQPVGVLIKPDGSMHPCQQLYDDIFCFANAITTEAIDYYKGLSFTRDIVKKRLSIVYNCTSCINRSVCQKGCMAEAYHNNGNYLAADGNCEMRIRQSLELGLSALLEKCADE